MNNNFMTQMNKFDRQIQTKFDILYKKQLNSIKDNYFFPSI